MGRGTRKGAPQAGSPPRGKRWFSAQLFGGPGNGLTVELTAYDARISVYRNGGPAYGVPDEPEPRSEPDPSFIGVYDLVGPIGPETPIYIPASD